MQPLQVLEGQQSFVAGCGSAFQRYSSIQTPVMIHSASRKARYCMLLAEPSLRLLAAQAAALP
jgi:hypothetical protein